MAKMLQRHFFTGLLALAPLAITFWILWRFYLLISMTMRPWLEKIPSLQDAYPDFFLTIIGLVVLGLLVVLVGVFTRNLIGMAFFRLVERVIHRIPLVKNLFSATKQLSEVFLQDRRTAFQKVVMFEYPRRGIHSVGFVTRQEPGELVSVFLPTTPNPTSGYMLLIPHQDLKELDVPVEDAIKMIVSGGSIVTEQQAKFIKIDSNNFGPDNTKSTVGKDPAK